MHTENSKIFKEQEEPSRYKSVFDTILTPTNASIKETEEAFKNINNYGKYASNLRNIYNQDYETLFELIFGPQNIAQRKIADPTGTKFKPKTKENIDTFTKIFYKDKVNIIIYKIDENNNRLIFDNDANPHLTQPQLEKIIKEVLDNAGIEYELNKEELNESKTIKLLDILKNRYVK
jgi:hypothetical protein